VGSPTSPNPTGLHSFKNNISPHWSWSWSSSCGWQSVNQFVWVSGLPLGILDQILSCSSFSSDNYFSLRSKASSLTRERVCSLQCNHSLVRSLTPNHTVPPHLRLCSLFVASYDSQGLRWKYPNPPPHGVPTLLSLNLEYLILHGPNRKHRIRQSFIILCVLIAAERLGKNVPAAINTHEIIKDCRIRCFLFGPCSVKYSRCNEEM
jgi:hypothetical protein